MATAAGALFPNKLVRNTRLFPPWILYPKYPAALQKIHVQEQIISYQGSMIFFVVLSFLQAAMPDRHWTYFKVSAPENCHVLSPTTFQAHTSSIQAAILALATLPDLSKYCAVMGTAASTVVWTMWSQTLFLHLPTSSHELSSSSLLNTWCNLFAVVEVLSCSVILYTHGQLPFSSFTVNIGEVRKWLIKWELGGDPHMWLISAHWQGCSDVERAADCDGSTTWGRIWSVVASRRLRRSWSLTYMLDLVTGLLNLPPPWQFLQCQASLHFALLMPKTASQLNWCEELESPTQRDRETERNCKIGF